MKKLFLFAATLLGLVACDKNEADINVPARQITIHATADMNNGSAASGPHRIAPNDITASSVSFYWQEGDKIWVLSNDFSEKQIFTIDNSSINGNQANFTGTALSDMSSYYVIYLDNMVSEETLMAIISGEDPVTYNYNPDSKNWFFAGEGHEDNFTIGCKSTIRMQLKGSCKLGKVVYLFGDPAEEDYSNITNTLNFVHDEYDGLQLSSTPVEVVIMPSVVSTEGFALRFYDTEDNLIMEKSKAGSSLCNAFEATLLVNLGVIEVALPIHNGHEYVDLGLPSGLKWATMNIGASTPEGYGDYFAWGETETKNDYSTDAYTYTDNPTVLPANHDAAAVKWQGNWRMPTVNEYQELFNNCKKEWTTSNGVNGYKLTGTKTGYTDKSIFFPAAGKRYNTMPLLSAETYGYYWSSSLYNGTNTNSAYCFRFCSTLAEWNLNYFRYYGLPIRPVCE